MTKPCRPRELVACVRAVLRRAGEREPVAKVLKADDVILNRDQHTVRVSDRYLDLTLDYSALCLQAAAEGIRFMRVYCWTSSTSAHRAGEW